MSKPMSGLLRGWMRPERARGQALVEFSLAVIVFLMLLMAIFDFGRAIYTYNGLAQAAREVARTASVHQDDSDMDGSAWSTQATSTINTQKALVPGLTLPLWKCVASNDASDSAGPTRICKDNEYIVVTTRSTYTPVSLLGFLGTINLEAKSRVQVPLRQTK
jgi:Flp pilus assembly protein TadG